MHYYEIHVPLRTNDGLDYSHIIEEFENEVLTMCNGYHRLPEVKGAWRENGKDFIETMIPFHIASDEPMILTKIKSIAFELFADQYAIFTAEIGEATINFRTAETSKSVVRRVHSTQPA